MTSWKEHISRDWDDARKFLQRFGDEWIFRGQRDSTWQLTTTLERDVELADQREAAEQRMLRDCQRRVHHYLEPHHIPPLDLQLDWLAMLQHHGAPTRLLDWTRSPFVAAFFAFEKQHRHHACAIWCLKRDWCERESRAKLIQIDSGLSPSCDLSDPGVFEKHVLPGRHRLVIPIEPFRMNQRLTAQQGLFTCAGDLDASLLDNLQALAGTHPLAHYLTKLVIIGEVRPEALYELNRMNINRGTLFPGIDGFIGSLRQQFAQRSRFRQAVLDAERDRQP